VKTIIDNEVLLEEEFKEINRLSDRGQLKKALKLCEALFDVYPENPRVLHGIGLLRYRTGTGREKAEQLLRKAIQLKPDFADACYNLGIMLQNAVLQDEAEELFRKTVEYEPENFRAITSLATVLITKDQIQEAQELCERALVLNKKYNPIYQNLASIMLAYGRADEAIKYIKKRVDSQLLFMMNLVSSFTQKDIFEESVRWGKKFSCHYFRKIHEHLNSRHPERRLRIGYVSGDFKLHPVTFHLKPVLVAHNKHNFEIFLYNSFPLADKLTEELSGYVSVYRDISSMSDDRTEKLIRKDGIDILVDLAGHTAFNRLGLFALKPAPVQISWLGYFNTTGLSTIDYLISDPITIPPGEEAFYSEHIFRLPVCRFCYQPMSNAPEVALTPLLRNGYVTFGSFNAIQKITISVIELWARLLHSIPNSRIILKSKYFNDKIVKQDVLSKFGLQGITVDRIELRPKSFYTDMLREYGDIDIALDTFPYNGGATTCEALWMGVPVVTLEGGTPISRQSKAFLYTIGHPEWVASTADEYVDIIQHLASNVDCLQQVRKGLRQKISDSPLCDGATFTLHLEEAYRWMWQLWCSENKPVESYRQFTTEELCDAGYNCLNDEDGKQAFDMFNRTLRRKPGHVQALNGLGKTYEIKGCYPAAIKEFRKAIRHDPSYYYSYFNLGYLLLNSGKFNKARTEFLRVLEYSPGHLETLVNLGVSNRLLGRLEEAQYYCEKVLEISPEHSTALGCLAFVLGDKGEIPRAIEILRRVMVQKPNNLDILSALLTYLFYDDDTNQNDILKLSKLIGFAFNQHINITPILPLELMFKDQLRIGFVSPDFCNHPVGQLLSALFKNFNAKNLSLFCYHNGLSQDAWTEWYQSNATAWRDITKMSDSDAAALIVEDKIDILVDLSGHTAGHRLELFSLHPVPVQVSWMGYGHTTGLPSIEYIIADKDFIRPEDEQWFSEQVVRLPFNRFCFVPPIPSPEVVEPPLYDNDYVTFGSFNNPMKISEKVVAIWAQILRQVPRSRLILKYKAYKDINVRNRYYALFAAHGIARSRIEFRKKTLPFFMMMEYGDIDIALDPFPFTGGMTSLLSLWMGVPIVTLSGELPISRQTESFLKLVGLQNFVAHSEDEYIHHAITLARNHERLCDIRSTLRDTMAASPLCDAKAHAAAVEHAFFEMWRMKVERTQKQPEVLSDGQ